MSGEGYIAEPDRPVGQVFEWSWMIIDNLLTAKRMKRLTRTERKEQIVAAAAGVFAEKGYSKALVAEVAVAAGIGKGTVYEYFRSKDELFFAVFEFVARESSGTAEAALARAAGKDAAGKLRALNRAVTSWIAGHTHLYTLSFEFWAASVSAVPKVRNRLEKSFQEIYGTFRKMVADIIREGVAAGTFKRKTDPYAVASAVVGSWDGLGLQSWFEPDFHLEKTAGTYMELLISGLVNDPADCSKQKGGRR